MDKKLFTNNEKKKMQLIIIYSSMLPENIFC